MHKLFVRLNREGNIVRSHCGNLITAGSPIPTQCFSLQTQWFCYIDTVILLRKHTTSPPLILSALLTYIQAHHDSIDNPRYQPPPRPQPRRCRLCCRHRKPWLTARLYSCRYTLRRTFFWVFSLRGRSAANF